MSATDELRRMLDERGVEWSDASDKDVLHTTWNNMNCWFIEFQDGWTAWGMTMHGTPEQAIAVTLGEVRAGSSRFELTAEQVRGVLLSHLPHREYYSVEQTDAWQAIADELNATLGGGECEQVLTDCDDGLMPPFTAHCSKCGTEWGFTPKFCPECGAKVVDK